LKALHRPDLFQWSAFDAARNVDFHGYCVVRPSGNILVDPLPMSEHDLQHLATLGGCAHIVVTNSDHTRGALALKERFGARLYGPAGEQGAFPADAWLAGGDRLDGALCFVVQGSKTPGELGLILGDTLLFGDVVRAHRADTLHLLPAEKLRDPLQVKESLSPLLDIPGWDPVLVGDGFPMFRGGREALRMLLS
jgi:glyoxylase-like metal-dependent hydrolase (beta-lactamase superfamily II)